MKTSCLELQDLLEAAQFLKDSAVSEACELFKLLAGRPLSGLREDKVP